MTNETDTRYKCHRWVLREKALIINNMAKIVYSHMKDYANTMRSLCIVHGGASVSLIYARMTGGWGVYIRSVSTEAMTVPMPSSALRPLSYVYDTCIVRAHAYIE